MPLLAPLALLLAANADFEDTHAIVNARIEVGDGRVIEAGTVLIRDGRIVAAGADVQAPRFADTIDGNGLTVYPGFIDAYATSPLALPEAEAEGASNNPETAPASMKVANRKGIRPDLRAADHLALTPQTLLAERRAGFTALLVAPTGGTINGRAALVELSGIPPREAVLVADAGMGFGFRTTGRSSYPGSLMGIIALLRQTMMDASYQAELRQMANAGASPAPYDVTLDTLESWRRSNGRTLFEADTQNELDRARRLATEFGLPNLTLVGALEAHRTAPALSSAGVRVIAGVNFGAEPPTPRPSAETPNTGDDQPSALALDRQARYTERVANLSRLHAAGVPFALTGRGTRDRAEFFRNLRRAVAAGLPRQVALRALTMNAAELFGLGRQMGTVEAGKLGYLTVMSGDFLDPEARVRYVFVRGRRFQPDRERPPTPPPRVPREEDGCDDHPHTRHGGGR